MLHEVTHDDIENKLEGTQFPDGRPSDDAGDHPQEQEDDRRPDHDLHQGTNQVVNSRVTTSTSLSDTDTDPEWPS
ncbi:hypothetical protein [Rhodococcus sp. NPDC057529]|uniref:hypothetical protein n=1 Tax=Rhodococcus sp. NPDC057529 TaxID=3346158 RepID=UPI00366D9C43